MLMYPLMMIMNFIYLEVGLGLLFSKSNCRTRTARGLRMLCVLCVRSVAQHINNQHSHLLDNVLHSGPHLFYLILSYYPRSSLFSMLHSSASPI